MMWVKMIKRSETRMNMNEYGYSMILYDIVGS